MIVFHKNLNILTSSPQPAIRDSVSECRRRITNCIHNNFTALSNGKFLFWDINFWSRVMIRITTVMMPLMQLAAFLSFSVMVPWGGRTQGVWPACGSRGSVTYSGVASHHNSHRNGNYELLNNHGCLLNCFLFGWKIYNFGRRKSGLSLYLFLRTLHSEAWSFRTTAHPNPPAVQHF